MPGYSPGFFFCIQTQGGEIFVPELPDVDAVLADNSARTKNVLADTLDALGNISVDTTTADRAYYDYLTANTEAKAAALSNALDAINATIDTAIAQKQAEGGDTSALMGLKMQMEGTLSGGLDTRSVHSVANHTVDALIALPREALSNAEYASLMSAYRMFEANPSDANAASVVAAGKQALDSMDIAQLEQSGVLTQSQSRALAEVKAQIENIDSGNGVGDNGRGGIGDGLVKKSYAKNRPKYGSTQVEDVWNAHVDPINGMAKDPTGTTIFWDRNKPRNGQWDMGHKPGQEYSDIHARYMSGEMSLDEFIKWFRDPDNYRPELIKTNRGHLFEHRDK